LTRRHLLRQGLWLVAFTIVYNILEGIVAIVAGWLAGSVALVGFGLDSTIETLSAVVVFIRLYGEYRGKSPDGQLITERNAEKFVGGTLFALCGYILFHSVSLLARQEPPGESLVGIVLAGLSLVIMPILAMAKRRTGRALGSRALIADSVETLVCTYLSFTLLLGLGLHTLLGWWWADPVAALIMVPFIFREAREAWSGEDDD
jgi:divalent metal cation (Fe/Co/Zn/Cd) transporter